MAVTLQVHVRALQPGRRLVGGSQREAAPEVRATGECMRSQQEGQAAGPHYRSALPVQERQIASIACISCSIGEPCTMACSLITFQGMRDALLTYSTRAG